MCATSAITDFYRDKWPVFDFHPIALPPIVIPIHHITQEEWEEYQELKRKMEQYDLQTGQPDCVKPEVAVWEAAIEAHLAGQIRSTSK